MIHWLPKYFLSTWIMFSRRISTSKVTVLGYGLLTTDAETLIDALNNQNFKVVIVDESHYMKSRSATRSRILLPIVQKAKRAILLTGTPALGRPEEVLTSLCLGLKQKMQPITVFIIFKLDASNAIRAHWKILGFYLWLSISVTMTVFIYVCVKLSHAYRYIYIWLLPLFQDFYI